VVPQVAITTAATTNISMETTTSTNIAMTTHSLSATALKMAAGERNMASGEQVGLVGGIA